ncbi:MAG: beta-aspartyl-peptidase [Rhodospirillaceae bacterium]
MSLLLKNAAVFAPAPLGVKDVLVIGGRIVAMDDALSVSLPGLETLDAQGLTLTPGLIDQHIHVTGGGGEGGPASRTPELVLSELVECGTTTVVGVSGTDSITRPIEGLLAKVRALAAEGVSAWMYTSNYAVPPTLLTGSIRKDLFCVPEVLGVKIAMGDHRCSFPSIDELMRIVSDIRVGGMIAGKTGFLHIHLGNLPGAFDQLAEVVHRGIPVRHLRPTHCARDKAVFAEAIAFAKAGGVIDVTSGGSCFDTPAKAIRTALEDGVDPERITMSTDGHGSIPRFDAQGLMVGLGIGGVSSNLREFRALLDLGLKPEQALPFLTSNVAKHLGLPGKGVVAAGADADLCLFDSRFDLRYVIAKGRMLMRDGAVEVKGTFEG